MSRLPVFSLEDGLAAFCNCVSEVRSVGTENKLNMTILPPDISNNNRS